MTLALIPLSSKDSSGVKERDSTGSDANRFVKLRLGAVEGDPKTLNFPDQPRQAPDRCIVTIT